MLYVRKLEEMSLSSHRFLWILMTLFMLFEVRNLEGTGQNPLLQNGLRSEPSWISPNHEWMHCIPSINELLISSVPEILSHLIVCLNRIQHIYIIYTILNIYSSHSNSTVNQRTSSEHKQTSHPMAWHFDGPWYDSETPADCSDKPTAYENMT